MEHTQGPDRCGECGQLIDADSIRIAAASPVLLEALQKLATFDNSDGSSRTEMKRNASSVVAVGAPSTRRQRRRSACASLRAAPDGPESTLTSPIPRR